MYNNYIDKLAHLLVNYSVEVKTGQKIMISGSSYSEALMRSIYVEVLKAGGHPSVEMSFEDQEYLYYAHSKDHQIDYVDELQLHIYNNIDASIAVFPNMNPQALSSVDPKLKQRCTKSREKLMETVFSRWGDGSFKWVGTGFPSLALAQEAKMSMTEYKEFVYSAMRLDLDDPVLFWKDFSLEQEKICKFLNQVKHVRIVGEDTDLSYSCGGRTWVNCDGRYNFPDGEVFTGPIEDSVEGDIRFTFPGIYQGQEIEDIRLSFEKGRVVKASAKKGEELLNTILDTDEGARYVGEAAIGTNKGITRFTKNMLFDEKMGGTIHMAVGRGIPESGSKNVSAVHWDMLKDMKNGGEIYADGNLIYKDGKFTISF
ncbi:aminopeptidase [bacterium]|nr:aminopeptidase [bacterium]